MSKGAPDFFDIAATTYVDSDITIIGNAFPHDKKYLDKSLTIEERWKSFLPIYSRLKNTGYVRSLRIGFRKVHNLDIIDATSIHKINESLKKLYQPGIYKKVLFDAGNIDAVLNYSEWEDGLPTNNYPGFFRKVRYIDNAIIFTTPEDLYALEKRYKVAVHGLGDFEILYRKFIEESIERGAVGFKSAAAYIRALDYARYTRDEAEGLLKKLWFISRLVERDE